MFGSKLFEQLCCACTCVCVVACVSVYVLSSIWNNSVCAVLGCSLHSRLGNPRAVVASVSFI